MLVRSLAFLRGLLPFPEHATLLCRRGIALRHLWSPSHSPPQPQMEVIYEPFERRSPPLPPSLGFCQHPLPHGAREMWPMLLSTA